MLSQANGTVCTQPHCLSLLPLSYLRALPGSALESVRSSETQREAGSRTLKMRRLKSIDYKPPACQECSPQWAGLWGHLFCTVV